nr:hypothetical protein [Micromonospora sp. DSM 115978]
DAAAKVLAPGAHLSIELPNPQSPAARWYGALWPGWFVPQHQHMMPADNVVAALGERGFEVLDLSFGQTHQNGDPSVALFGLLQRTAPSPTALWSPEAEPARRLAHRARRVAVGSAVAAAMPAAVLADAGTRPYLASGQPSNAFPIQAKR